MEDGNDQDRQDIGKGLHVWYRAARAALAVQEVVQVAGPKQ